MLTRKEIELALPPSLKRSATQALTDLVNNVTSDPLEAETIRENFLTYTTVLKEGKYKTEDYLNAVTYVSYKLMGLNNQESYRKTFPTRWAALLKSGRSQKDIASYVAMYHKNKMVQKIMEQSLVPVWLLNQENYQRAINVQVELMTTAHSEKVRCDAANSILNHLSKPKESGPTINIDIAETSGMKELKAMMEELAGQQLAMIQGGATTKEIAGQRIFENED